MSSRAAAGFPTSALASSRACVKPRIMARPPETPDPSHRAPAATNQPDAARTSSRKLPLGLQVNSGPDALAEEADLPPVVARMVVEIRSDGSRTVARGALEDLMTGEKVALRADAASPLALAQQLTGALLKTPVLAKQTLSGLLPRALKKRLPFDLK